MLFIFKGIGISIVIFTSIIANYYNMYPAWVLYYLFKSLTSSLPWSDCDNTWNTPNCYEESGKLELYVCTLMLQMIKSNLKGLMSTLIIDVQVHKPYLQWFFKSLE